MFCSWETLKKIQTRIEQQEQGKGRDIPYLAGA